MRVGQITPREVVMDEMDEVKELPYPEWQVPLKEVILESDREKLAEKALKSETQILERLRQLQLSNNGHREREAIANGLSILRMIRRDRLDYPDWGGGELITLTSALHLSPD